MTVLPGVLVHEPLGSASLMIVVRVVEDVVDPMADVAAGLGDAVADVLGGVDRIGEGGAGDGEGEDEGGGKNFHRRVLTLQGEHLFERANGRFSLRSPTNN